MGFSKECTKCGKVKWWYQFTYHPRTQFNLKTRCRVCVAIANREYQKQPNGKKAKAKAQRKWQRKNIEKRKEYWHKFYLKHGEIYLMAQKLKISMPEVREALAIANQGIQITQQSINPQEIAI